MNDCPFCANGTGFKCPLCKDKIYLVINKLETIEDAFFKAFNKIEDANKFIESLGNAAQYYLTIPVDIE